LVPDDRYCPIAQYVNGNRPLVFRRNIPK